jgi:hypothetical protein
MERAAALVFADQLRIAREAAFRDAEAFDGIIQTVERLGRPAPDADSEALFR